MIDIFVKGGDYLGETICDVDRFNDTYFDYLIERSGLERMDILPNYDSLIKYLYRYPFRYLITFDKNRASDGLGLRTEFCCVEHVENYLFCNRDCSVLEMLVALAIRVEKEYIGDPMDEKPEQFLWEMICNLGLNHYPNMRFDGFFVSKILEKWLDRRFDCDGFGSIFPMKGTIRDQRKIEIWSQMNEYLSENYPF